MPEYCFDEIAINSKEKKKPTEEDKYTYIGLEHLDTGSLSVTRWGSEIAPVGDKLVMRKGDVLFGKRRAYQKKVAIAPFDGIFSAHGMVLRPKEAVTTKEFFPLFISSDYFLDAAIKISVGSLSPTINWNDLKELVFTIPTIEEQKQIAPLIWAAIDAKNAYKKLLSSIDDLVKSQFIEMFGDCIENEKEWPTKPLMEVLAEGRTVTYGIVKTEDDIPGGVPVFRPVDISQGHVPHRAELKRTSAEISQQYKRTVLKGNELLITVRGSIGETFQITDEFSGCNVARNIVPLEANSEILDQGFLKIVLDSPAFQRRLASLTKGVALKGINMNEFKMCPIILPPLRLQRDCVRFFKQSDKSKFELTQAIARIDDMIKALMQG